MTNRIFTLPSGATVVLKAPSHDALSELHGLKVFFNDRVAKDIEADRLNLERHRRDPALYGIDQLQTSTPQMRRFIADSVLIRKQNRQEILGKIFDPDTKIIGTPKELSVNPAFTALLEERQYSTRGLTHPRDTFSNCLDSFNRKAKKRTIEQNPILQLTPLQLPKEGRGFVDNPSNRKVTLDRLAPDTIFCRQVL